MTDVVLFNKWEHKNRVVISGIGVVSPIGIGKDLFWEGLSTGKSGIKPITLFDTSTISSKLAGEISGFNPEEILGAKGLRNLDRTTKLALCAAKLCLDDADFEVTEANSGEIGVALGSSMGSVWSVSEFDKDSLRGGLKAVNPAHFPNTVINSPASQISIRFNIKGFNATLSSGFTSSLDALEYARNFLILNRVKAVLVGGVEELCEQTFKGFYKIGFLSKSRGHQKEFMAPFDRNRNGTIMGEGSAIFLLERLEDARKRKSKIYAVLSGHASVFDENCYNRYSLKAVGAKKAILKALERANKDARSIDCVAASANSTLDGDISESRALASIFNHQQKKVIASASKSMTGETFSAGGGFQVASACLALNKGVLPPTINFTHEDRRCLVDCVPNKARSAIVDNVLISDLSPTGQCSALILEKADL